MKKQLILLMMMLLPMVASADDSGTCGTNVTYTYVESTHTLTISGTGTMDDYIGYNYAPWYNYRSEIVKVIIEDGVTSIGGGSHYYRSGAFCGCDGLTSITIPNSVTSIGSSAFSGCSSLISITIPNSVTKIESYSFSGCSSLISFTIPNSVTSIGEDAFNECCGLTSITIPNSVTDIGGCAFRHCTGLTSIAIPNSVTAIGYDAFAGCSGLTSITIPEGVTSIKGETFYGCSGLTSITIPEGVTSVESRAFSGCSGLISVTIPNSVTSIGEDAFYGCYRISSVNISDMSAWCSIKYGSNSNFLFPSNHHLYLNGVEIEQLMIPSDITSLGNYIFYGCSYLTSIIIPNSVTSIGEGAFAGCSKVESLKLPDNLQIIKKATFKGCSSLKTVTIPATVEVIYQEAFADCYALENVKAKPGTPPFLYDNSFSNFSIPLEVPKGCKEEYQSAQGWKKFTNISESDKGYYKLIYLVDNEEYKSYKIEEGSSITPEPEPAKDGYTFSGWSEIPETMPAHDVTITGTFSINKYKLTYTVDGEEYKTYEVEYGVIISPEAAPTKDGYTFSGWSEIPETMPAHDVTVTGIFSINKYKLTYTVDGEEYKTYEVEYGATITPEAEPTKEGYTFSGWSEIPETMPAHDVTVTGTFNINSYKLTYMIDDKVYKETMYEYGATITPEPQPEGDYQTFEWTDLPQTMPAHDVVVHASYTSGIIEVLMASQQNVRIYSPNGKKLNKLQKGINIIILNDGTVKKIVIK